MLAAANKLKRKLSKALVEVKYYYKKASCALKA